MASGPWSGRGNPAIGHTVKGIATKVLPAAMVKEHFAEKDPAAEVEGIVTGGKDGRSVKVTWKVADGVVHFGQHKTSTFVCHQGGNEANGRGSSGGSGKSGREKRATMEELTAIAEGMVSGKIIEFLGDDSDLDDAEIEKLLDPGPLSAFDTDLIPHGQQWKISNEEIETDARQEPRFKPRLKWGGEANHLDGHTILETFLLMMPNILETACNTFNQLKPASSKVLTVGELLLFLGLCVAMGLVRVRTRRGYWTTPENQDDEEIFPAANFGRWGMGVNRWEEIFRYIGWFPLDDTSNYPADDPWRCVRYFVDQFNARRLEVFVCSWVICADESTVKWRGADGSWHPDGMPHVSKILRKPETLSMEVRNICCAESNIFLKLEIQEGAEAMGKKEYVAEFGKSVGGLMRLVKDYANTVRVVVGDSAFASVAAAIALFKLGLYFIGLVKNAHRLYPMGHMKNHKFERRGDTHTCTTTKDGVSLIAHTWADPNKPGKKNKSLIATCGTTVAANPCERPRKLSTFDPDTKTRTCEDVTLVVPRTILVWIYFNHCGAIDRANRVVQDGFRLARNIETRHWQRRAWLGILGFVLGDTYHAWKLQGNDMPLQEFIERLSFQLITNTYDADQVRNTYGNAGIGGRGGGKRSSEGASGASKKCKVNDNEDVGRVPAIYWHTPKPCAGFPGCPRQIVCKVCRERGASLLCSSCSEPNKHYFGLCNPSTGRDCVAKHIYSKV